jgi:hypothetical protein
LRGRGRVSNRPKGHRFLQQKGILVDHHVLGVYAWFKRSDRALPFVDSKKDHQTWTLAHGTEERRQDH